MQIQIFTVWGFAAEMFARAKYSPWRITSQTP